MPVLIAGVGGFGLLILAWALSRLARRMRSGTLPRDYWVGIRTAATTNSEAAWQAGHQAAEPLTRVTARVAVVVTVLTLGLALVLQVASVAASVAAVATLVALAVDYLVFLALNIWAAVIADRAARHNNP